MDWDIFPKFWKIRTTVKRALKWYYKWPLTRFLWTSQNRPELKQTLSHSSFPLLELLERCWDQKPWIRNKKLRHVKILDKMTWNKKRPIRGLILYIQKRARHSISKPLNLIPTRLRETRISQWDNSTLQKWENGKKKNNEPEEKTLVMYRNQNGEPSKHETSHQ